ncbi:MAG: hypothetical protein QMC80_03835 [Thermoplasmatales archaeon]|nr:hypothetical protein [Thermoplasmatales archaeon]
MSIINILMYLPAGILYLFVLMFTYYTLKNARFMHDSLGHNFMAVSAILYLTASIIGTIDAYYPKTVLHLATFSIAVAGLFFIIAGGYQRWRNIQKVLRTPLLKILTMMPHASFYLTSEVALVLCVPFYIMDILHRVGEGGLSWLSFITASLLGFAFVLLTVAERRFHLAVQPSAAAGGEETALLRNDILAVRSYAALTNTFLATIKHAVGDKLLKDVLTKHFEYNPVLFEGCEIKDDGTVNIEPAVKNLDNLHRENRVQLLCSMFSALNAKIMNLYGAVTSPDLAKKALGVSYLTVKKQYGAPSIFFEILRSLPEGVLEEERLALLSREELEVRVRERTAELEKAYKELKKKVEPKSA